jgi:membrane-bound serine protease (ClpP class)
VRIIRRLVPLAAVALAIATFLAAPTAAQDQGLRGAIVQIPLEGVVDPFVADHITGQIDRAETEDATAVLLTIDTPGGLDSSMREITQAILNADLPVIAYVFPAGARAASAGTFILLSAHVAAMAPGTNVGAAHPVGLSGPWRRRRRRTTRPRTSGAWRRRTTGTPTGPNARCASRSAPRRRRRSTSG